MLRVKRSHSPISGVQNSGRKCKSKHTELCCFCCCCCFVVVVAVLCGCGFVCICVCVWVWVWGCGGVLGCVCDMFKCSVTISTQPLRNAMRYTGFQVSDVGWNARSLCTSVDWKRGECSLQTVLCSKCSKLKRNVKIRKIKILSVPYKTKGFVWKKKYSSKVRTNFIWPTAFRLCHSSFN